MEFDADFEFDCPKYIDFTTLAASQPQDYDSCLSPSSLDDSWFEREHLLHEPKHPKKHGEALKPLIEINENKPTTVKKVSTKPNSSKNANNKNAKKSLGVKASVRVKRGEHGTPGRRKLPDKGSMQVKNSKVIKGKSGSVDGLDGNKLVGDEFYSSQAREFTPPWNNTCSSPYRAVSSEAADVSPKSSHTKMINSPLHATMPLRAQAPPAQGAPTNPSSVISSRSLDPIKNHGLLLLKSPPVNSKSSLLAKAVGGAAQRGQPNSGAPRRRVLPAIPCQKQDNIAQFPVRGSSRPLEIKVLKTPPSSPLESHAKRKDTLINKHTTLNTEQPNDMSPVNQPVRVVVDTAVHVGVDGSCRKETNLKLESGNNLRVNGSDYGDIVEQDKLGIISEVSGECTGLGKEQNTEGMDKMSVEDLVKLHNQRVLSGKAKYDENGRRIRTGEPAFCPAPTKSEVSSQKTSKSTKVRTCAAVPSASRPATGQKRASGNSDEIKTAQKQNRRSCVAAPLAVTTIAEQALSTETPDEERMIGKQTVSKISSATSTASASNPTQGGKSFGGLSVKRSMSTSELKGVQKQKRRSCAAMPAASTLPSSAQPNKGETSGEERMIGKQTVSKISSATSTTSASNPTQGGKSFGGLSVKRSMSTSELKGVQKQKRRSCAAMPAGSTLPSSTQPNKGVAGTGSNVGKKRRSCVAAPQSAGKTATKLDKADQDLMDLIARHNERLASQRR